MLIAHRKPNKILSDKVYFCLFYSIFIDQWQFVQANTHHSNMLNFKLINKDKPKANFNILGLSELSLEISHKLNINI